MIRFTETGPATLGMSGSMEHTQKARASRERRGNVASKAGQVTSGSDCLSFHFKCGAAALSQFCISHWISCSPSIFLSGFKSCIHIGEKAWLWGSQNGCRSGSASGRRTFCFCCFCQPRSMTRNVFLLSSYAAECLFASL